MKLKMLDLSDEEDCVLSNALDDYEKGLNQPNPDRPNSSNVDEYEGLGSSALEIPLHTLRRGRHLRVTDIASQLWCEKQVEYSLKLPELKAEMVDNNPVVKAGKTIHLAKELEVHDFVPVETFSREDSWSVELLNAYQQLLILHSGQKVREFSIFGNILSSDIGVRGIIDEIRPSLSGGLTIVELKTRADGQRFVSKSRLQRDGLQLMIYKHLFEKLDETLFDKKFMQEKFNLNFQQHISRGVIDYTRQLHLDCQTFDDVLTVVQTYLSISPLPPIDNLLIEYISQNTGNTLLEHSVVWDEAWFENTTVQMLSFWLGKREAKGVDVEEAYKCLYCPFSDICTWRLEKHKILSQSNGQNFTHYNAFVKIL